MIRLVAGDIVKVSIGKIENLGLTKYSWMAEHFLHSLDDWNKRLIEIENFQADC